MNTLYINYTKTGEPISDCQVESKILDQAFICGIGRDNQWDVSTENVVLCARMLKLSGKITCDLEIMFEGHLLEMNRYCVIIHGYPYGFCDYMDRWAAELLTRQVSLKKQDRDILTSDTQ